MSSKYLIDCCALYRRSTSGLGAAVPEDGREWTELPRGAVHDQDTHQLYPDVAAYRAALGIAKGSIVKETS